MAWWGKQSAQTPRSRWNLDDYHTAFAAHSKAQIEQGVSPWQKPLTPGAGRLPENIQTGTPYRGSNSVYLSVTQTAQGYRDNRWATYKQIHDRGGQVRTGEKATHVLFYKFDDQQEKAGAAATPATSPAGAGEQEQTRPPMVRVYAVFNVEQADHVTLDRRDDQDKVPEWKAHQTAERVIRESGIHVAHVRGDRAFYNMETDKVTLPEREQMATANGYYQTAMHELGHATGHPLRMDRDTLKNGAGNFGCVEYAREELRVEMSAMLTGDCVGVGHDGSRGAAYVKGWITALDQDPREICKAAGDAQKISDYLMRTVRAREQETAQQQRALAEKYSAARSPQISSAPTSRPLDPRPPLPVGADGGPRADDRQPEGDPQPRRARRSRAGDKMTSSSAQVETSPESPATVPTLQDRAGQLAPLGWTGREAEWLALVALHSGVFTRSQCRAHFQAGDDRKRLSRFVRALIEKQLATEDERPIFPDGARAVLLTGKPIYRALGIPDVRHRRGKDATTQVLMRRLLSLDYIIERPTFGWLPTEDDKVQRFEALGVDRANFPYRKYGQPGIPRYFAFKLPIAVDDQAATFAYVDSGQTTDSELRAWGAAHAPLWAALRARTFAVHVVAVGTGAEAADRAAPVLKHWTRDGDGTGAADPTGPTQADPDIRQEIARLKAAIPTGNRSLLSAWGGFKMAVDRLLELRQLPEGTPTTTTARVAIDRFQIWSPVRLTGPEAAI